MEIAPRQLEIIEAAGKILTISGISGLTIKNLAKEMQFAESALYRHFNNKEEIIVTMLRYLASNIDERLAKLKHSSIPEENFRNLFFEQINFFIKKPHFVVAVFSDGFIEESQKINETLQQLISVKLKHVTNVISEGQQSGVFTNNIDAEQLSSIIVGAFKFQMFKWKMANFQYNIKDSGEKMIESLLMLIKSKTT